MSTSRLYYEAHVNFARNADARIAGDKIEAEFSNWRLATFEMHKDREPTGFLTGRHKELAVIKTQTLAVVSKLREWGFEVLRWKIEDTLLDSKQGDDILELGK